MIPAPRQSRLVMEVIQSRQQEDQRSRPRNPVHARGEQEVRLQPNPGFPPPRRHVHRARPDQPALRGAPRDEPIDVAVVVAKRSSHRRLRVARQPAPLRGVVESASPYGRLGDYRRTFGRPLLRGADNDPLRRCYDDFGRSRQHHTQRSRRGSTGNPSGTRTRSGRRSKRGESRCSVRKPFRRLIGRQAYQKQTCIGASLPF